MLNVVVVSFSFCTLEHRILQSAMSEKKRVQVGVEASAGAQGDAFDFSSFQAQFSDGSAAGNRPAPPTGGDDDMPYHTSYQCRKTSIAEGMTTEALVDEHRKSIAGLAVKETGRPVDMHDLTGITLSKRHTVTQIEYEAELDAAAYTALGGYNFGLSAEAADAATN